MGNACAKLKEANARQWIIFGMMILNLLCSNIANVAFGKDRSNGAISDANRVLITPPGWAFSIWGLIFISEPVFAVWQLFLSPKVYASHFWNFAGFIGMSVAQSIWALSFPFSNDSATSNNTMRFCFVAIFSIWWFLLATNVVCNRTAQAILDGEDTVTPTLLPFVGDSAAAENERNTTHFASDATKSQQQQQQQQEQEQPNKKNYTAALVYYFLCCFPMAVHLGWITAATSLNLLLVVARENDTLAPQLAASIVAACLISVTAWTRGLVAGDLGVAGALIWAISAIAKRDTSLPVRVGMPPSNNATVFAPQVVHDGLTQVAVTLAILIGVLCVAWKVLSLVGAVERINKWFDGKGCCSGEETQEAKKDNNANSNSNNTNTNSDPLAVVVTSL